MENVENLILEHLKALRTGQDNIVFEVKEVKSRLTSLESITAGGRRDGPCYKKRSTDSKQQLII